MSNPISEKEIFAIIDMAVAKSLDAAKPNQKVKLNIQKTPDGKGMVVETFLEPKDEQPKSTK